MATRVVSDKEAAELFRAFIKGMLTCRDSCKAMGVEAGPFYETLAVEMAFEVWPEAVDAAKKAV